MPAGREGVHLGRYLIVKEQAYFGNVANSEMQAPCDHKVVKKIRRVVLGANNTMVYLTDVSFFLLVSHLRLSQRRDDPAVG